MLWLLKIKRTSYFPLIFCCDINTRTFVRCSGRRQWRLPSLDMSNLEKILTRLKGSNNFNNIIFITIIIPCIEYSTDSKKRGKRNLYSKIFSSSNTKWFHKETFSFHTHNNLSYFPSIESSRCNRIQVQFKLFDASSLIERNGKR